MNVSIINEWILPQENEVFKKTSKENPMFYVVRLQKDRTRYLKIGTTERDVAKRFKDKDYKKYSTIKILYVAEVSEEKRPADACYHIEDLTRSAIREMKGFNFVKNDRFTYFRLPDEIPMYTSLTSCKMIPLH